MDGDGWDDQDVALFRALVTFGGDQSMGRDAEASLMPDTPLEYRAGIHWDAPNGTDTALQNETDAEELKAQQLRQQFLNRQFKHERSRNSR